MTARCAADSDDVSPRSASLSLTLPLTLSLIAGVSLVAQTAPTARLTASTPSAAAAPGAGANAAPVASPALSMTAGGSAQARRAAELVLDSTAAPQMRAETLRALGVDAAGEPGDRPFVRETAMRVLDSGLPEIRVAAAQALGATGPDSVPGLIRAMQDAHYEVRTAAALGLGTFGRYSLPAADALAGALDPFLGVAAEAGSALLAIGPEALPSVEARLKAAQPTDRARPMLIAVERSLRDGRDHLSQALEHDVPHGPDGKGFIWIEPLRTTATGTAYVPGKHRIRARFATLPYGPPRKIPEDIRETSLVAWESVNTGLAALAGRRAGDRVRLLMSPDIAESLVFGTSQHSTRARTHISGTPGYFDVKIERVCEPQIWTLYKGGPTIGPIAFEMSCSD
jgi:hypothetical protein